MRIAAYNQEIDVMSFGYCKKDMAHMRKSLQIRQQDQNLRTD